MGSTRQTVNTLLTFFVFCINATAFACAVSFVHVRQNFETIIAPTVVDGDNLSFIFSTLNDQAIMYFVCASVTALACIYSLVTIPCGWKGQWARHGDFFITFISLCFQVALTVMSSINMLVSQQNLGPTIQAADELADLQQLVIIVGTGGFAMMIPSLGFLLFQKWAIFTESMVEQTHLVRASERASRASRASLNKA